jgi:signal transduction histidine kinase
MSSKQTPRAVGAAAKKTGGSSKLVVASILLGLFVLFDLGLLGWLIFRSLSEREIERVLLETRSEAENLARELASSANAGHDLYTVIVTEQEFQSYIDSIPKNRDIVRSVEIRDKEKKLVFKAQGQFFTPPRAEGTDLEAPRGEGPSSETSQIVHEETYQHDLEVPIGELGFLNIGINQVELQKRIGVLREELVRQTALIGAVTLVVLALAYITIFRLWKRGRGLEEQAREAERMAYIGTLASGLAHEIRNPLNSLNLNIQLLEEEAGPALAGRSPRRLLDITQEEIGRLERLVTDFLLYAKPRPLDREKVPAVDLLARCRDLLAKEFATRQVELLLEDRTEGALVSVDAGQMTQLLVNLAQNGLAAAQGGPRKPRVVLAGDRRGSKIVLEVADNGGGIRPEDREKIFEVFYSTRKGGTGLGLAVVQRIARDHGGEVEVHSAVGSGTRIRVVLDEAPHAQQPAAERSASPPAREGARA